MYIAVDAIANDDDPKLSYLMFPYDEDFLDALEENLKEIRVEDEITFSLDDVLLIRGEYNYVRKKVNLSKMALNRYCIGRNTEGIPKLERTKLHVTNDYFYFSGYRKPINRHDKSNVMFVSENFNLVFLEDLKKYVKKNKEMVE